MPPLLSVCITAGSGEYNLGQTEPYLDLAQKAVIKLNSVGGHALFVLDPNGVHNLPPLALCKQCWTFVEQGATSIAENENSALSNIIAYPLPSNGEFYIKLTAELTKGIKIKISSITGEQIDHYHVTSIDNSTIKIDLSNKADGMYFIRVFTEIGVKTIKIAILK
jgi:hypothetical protein